MRRLLAILLLAAFGFPAAAPALELGQSANTRLPACCRRTGAHHCMGNMAASTHGPAISAVCPSFPQPAAIASAVAFSALTVHATLILTNISTLTPTQRADIQRRISRERSRHKRGPPSFVLS